MNNELLTAGNLYGSLINDIGNILVEARGKICREINSVMVDAYWNIGKYIVEYEIVREGIREKQFVVY